MMLILVITFSAIPLSLQQLHLQNAFAQDDSQTDTEQRLRQKNTGSGESTNFNSGEEEVSNGDGKGPNCPAGSSFNFSTGRCEAQPTTEVVGRPTCPPQAPFFDPTSPFSSSCFILRSPETSCPPGTTPGLGLSCETAPVCLTGTLNPDTLNCERPTCPQGTTLSGNVCTGHPIPKGPKQT